jgi:ribosomal protein L9|tara:strand:+ start:236 stop:904 length:669 start_codon:yes stop_codon:yes gene_type:complete
MSQPKSLRETYFDPDYKELKYINEDTTLYALHLHGYISTYLVNSLSAFSKVGELLDAPIMEISKKARNFGPGCRKELKSFFENNYEKFRLKSGTKNKDKSQGTIKALEKKLKKYEQELYDLMEDKNNLKDDLENSNLDLTAHKSLETTLYEEIETLKIETEKAKKDYDNYYRDRIRDFEEKIKVKDLDISTLKLYNVEAFQSLQEMRNKMKVYEELKNKIDE